MFLVTVVHGVWFVIQQWTASNSLYYSLGVHFWLLVALSFYKEIRRAIASAHAERLKMAVRWRRCRAHIAPFVIFLSTDCCGQDCFNLYLNIFHIPIINIFIEAWQSGRVVIWTSSCDMSLSCRFLSYFAGGYTRWYWTENIKFMPCLSPCEWCSRHSLAQISCTLFHYWLYNLTTKGEPSNCGTVTDVKP